MSTTRGVHTVTWSNARNAAGICALCAGFMLATGSGIAAADPGSNEPGTHSNAPTPRTAPDTAPKPGHKTDVRLSGVRTPNPAAGPFADAVQKTIQDVFSVFGSGRLPGQPTATATGQTTRPSPVVVADTTEIKNNSKTVTAAQDAAAAAPDVATSTTATVNTGSSATTPVVNTAAPVAAPVTPVVAPVTQPIITATAIPWVITPVVNVLSTIQYVVTAAVYTVTNTVVPIASDLVSLLSVGALTTQPVAPILDRGPLTSPGPGAPALAPQPFVPDASGLIFPTVAAGVPATVAAGTTAGILAPSMLDLAGPTQPSEVTGEVPLADTSIFPASLKRFFEHAVSAVLSSPSLSVLAALALPGFLGLLIIAGAGIRLGYRQAKAALMLPTSTLARFAAPQPLRLVRSRSAVTLSRSASRFVPRELSSAGRALENAA
jgi:hypothetical protein